MPAALAAPPHLPRPNAAPQELGPAARRLLALGVLAAHVAGAWALLQAATEHPPVAETAMLRVEWIAPPAPTPAAPPPPPSPRRAVTPPTPQPVVVAAPAAPSPAAHTAAPQPEPTPAPVVAAPAPPAPPLPPAAPATPRMVPASALRYTVLPQQVYPLASRRLGEQGVVQVKVVVDMRGLPRLVALHQSSGHARLDEQAQAAMRAARFQPCTEQGQPIECMAIAPLAYELD